MKLRKFVIFFLIILLIVPSFFFPQPARAASDTWWDNVKVTMLKPIRENSYVKIHFKIELKLENINPPNSTYAFRLKVDSRIVDRNQIANLYTALDNREKSSNSEPCNGEVASNVFSMNTGITTPDPKFKVMSDNTDLQSYTIYDYFPQNNRKYQIEIFGKRSCPDFDPFGGGEITEDKYIWAILSNEVTYVSSDSGESDDLDQLLADAYQRYARLVVDIEDLFTTEGSGEENLKYWEPAMSDSQIVFINFTLDAAPAVVSRFLKGLINITPKVPQALKNQANIVINGFNKAILENQIGSGTLIPTDEGVKLIDTISNNANELLKEDGIIDQLEKANPDSENFMSPMMKFIRSLPEDDSAESKFKQEFGDPIYIVTKPESLPPSGITNHPKKDYAHISQYFLASEFNPKIFEGGVFKNNPNYVENTAFTKALKQSFDSITDFRAKIQSVYDLAEKGIDNFLENQDPCESNFLTALVKRNLAGFMICIVGQFVDNLANFIMEVGLKWIRNAAGL